MSKNAPPFSVTNTMLTLVAEIAEKTGRITSYRSFETKPYLRRNNRIRSIHSSLAIEANSLSVDEVRSVINGRTVIGPEKEIQEVKNAYQAYDMLGKFDPYSLKDLAIQKCQKDQTPFFIFLLKDAKDRGDQAAFKKLMQSAHRRRSVKSSVVDEEFSAEKFS